MTMIFFSALAFTVLENAMSVIFYHRVALRHRHFIVSVLLPYLFIVFLGVGLLVVTVVSGKLGALATHNITVFGVPHSLSDLSQYLLYLARRRRRNPDPDRDLSGDARGPAFVAPRAHRRRHRGIAVGDHAPCPGLVLRHHVTGECGLRLAHDRDPRTALGGDRRHSPAVRCAGHRRVRADRSRACAVAAKVAGSATRVSHRAGASPDRKRRRTCRCSAPADRPSPAP